MRQFEPHITRSGGIPSKYRFTTRCSTCSKTDSYEANQSVSDDVIKGYFNERGWLLGRDRSHDLCPACLARPRDSERWGADTPRHHPARTARQPDRDATPMKAHHKDTADILARHLGKPKALAAEVFRPKQVQPPRPAAPDAAPQPVPSSVLSPDLEQSLTGMAADLKSLRATMELIAEQVSKLVALGGQQIEAIAQLAPAMIQSTDRISGELKDIVSAVRLNSAPSDEGVRQSAPLIEPPLEQDQEVHAEPDITRAAQPATPMRRIRRPRANESTGRRSAADHAAVKSIADAKRPGRFYTTIRLPRELWDQSGFGPDDRIQLDCKRKTVSISRVPDGGVKPKTIGDAVVVLQSWRLGDLNFDPTKITSENGVLRLTSP